MNRVVQEILSSLVSLSVETPWSRMPYPPIKRERLITSVAILYAAEQSPEVDLLFKRLNSLTNEQLERLPTQRLNSMGIKSVIGTE